MLALLVAGSYGVIQAFEDSSRAEVANEFDCISERPPPPTCQKRAVTTTTSTTITVTTTTLAPTTTTAAVTTTTVPAAPSTAAWTAPTSSDPPGNTWNAGMTLTLTTSSGPVSNATVVMSVLRSNGTEYGTFTCTTNASGACSFVVAIPNGLTPVRFAVSSVTANPPVEPPTQQSPLVSRP